MASKTSGVSVNPTFISSVNSLKAARSRMNAAKLACNGNENEAAILQYRKAEADFHKAEAVYSQQCGIVEGGNLTQEQAEAQVKGIMQNVMSYYA